MVRHIDLWFLRRFSKFRETETQRLRLFEHAKETEREKAELQKKVVSDSNLIESLNRYIEALEGRDRERVERINELVRVCCEAQELINKLWGHLSGITPQ